MAVKELSANLVMDSRKDAFWRVRSKDSANVVTTKVLSHEAFVNLLKSNTIIRKERPRTSLGKLPFGYVDCLYSEPGNYKIAVYYPEKLRGVKYYKEKYRVFFPNCLFVFDVQKGRLSSRYVFAVKDKVITPETVLWEYPFGNVSQGSGGICMGNIRIPDCTNMSAIDEVVELFFNGETNDDLYSKGRTKKNCEQYKLYQYLEGKKKFPYQILNECVPSYREKKSSLRFKDVFK